MTTRLHFAILAIATAAFGLTATIAQAQGEEDARHHFRLGEAHYESGHFEDAGREFEESFRLSGRTQLLHNVYVAYRDAGNIRLAAHALERYLEQHSEIQNRAMLMGRLAGLQRLIAQMGGSEGNEATTSRTETTSPTETETTTPSVTPEATGSSSGPSEDTGGAGLSPIGFIVGGVGAALAIGGAITGGLAMDQESSLAAACPGDVCPDGVDYESMVSNGQTLALVTDILIPVGIAALAAGVVLILVLEGDSGTETAAGAFCGPDGCMGAIRTSF